MQKKKFRIKIFRAKKIIRPKKLYVEIRFFEKKFINKILSTKKSLNQNNIEPKHFRQNNFRKKKKFDKIFFYQKSD